FELDAAIIFADILTPLIGMGIELDFVDGVGPVIHNPIRSPSDIDRLFLPDVRESVGYTLQAISEVEAKLSERRIPLIGFSGAPFTLSKYMIEGGRSSGMSVKEFMLAYPEPWARLQEKLVDLISSYLINQLQAGASAVQIFDSWAGELGEIEYINFSLPYLKEIVGRIKSQREEPIIYFSTGTGAILPIIKGIGVDCVSVDWRIPLKFAREVLGDGIAIQGNLDPYVLLSPNGYLEESALRILGEGSLLPGYIFNLGHGLLPNTPVESVAKVVSLVRGWNCR
ncbi:MAG: uroporphyrinogen decarboxylase, partial [Candidatus Dadabacteria bacterium]